jgi:hypothetical protein
MIFAKSSIIYEENGEGRHWGLQRLGAVKGVGKVGMTSTLY